MPLEIEHEQDCPDKDVTHLCACVMRYCEKMAVEAEALRRIISEQCSEVISLNKRLQKAKGGDRE